MSAARFEPQACGPAMLALPDVMRITGYCRTTLYEAMLAGELPRPVKVGRASRWPEDEVLALRTAIVRGDDESARRALVRQLQARRGRPHLALA